MPTIAVFCSGQGTNLQAILNAIKKRRLRAMVACVISDRADALALQRAKRVGVQGYCINPADHATRADYERALSALCETHRVRLICLAGFMRILSPAFVRRYRQKILNIHPALLPAFPGAHAVRDALAWGAKVTGVTVHFVDEQIDHGPVILQEAIRILTRDTESALLGRLHRIEHRLYPQAIQLVLEGRAKNNGRRVIIRNA